MSIIKGKTNVVAGFGGTKRCIGEVYFSQSGLASDNPGALPGWTGEYYENGKTLFPDLYNFVKAHSELQVTKTEYDNAIAAYGECPKYVVDENTAQTSLRLPKYKNSGRYLVKKEINGNDWYALYSDGWLEQGGSSIAQQSVTFIRPFANKNYTLTTAHEFGNSSDANIWLQFAKNSKTTTGFTWANATTPANTSINWEAKGYAAATPMENIKYPWIVSFTAAVPASTAQAAEFTGALSGKADTSLANLSTAGKSLVSGLGFPSSRYTNLTLGANGATYTAPANGYFCLDGKSGVTNNFSISFYNNTTRIRSCVASNKYADWVSTYIPAKKGDVITLLYDNVTVNTHDFLFIYAEGNK